MDEQLAVALVDSPSFTNLKKGDVITIYEQINATGWYRCRSKAQKRSFRIWNIHNSDFKVIGAIKDLSALERAFYGL